MDPLSEELLAGGWKAGDIISVDLDESGECLSAMTVHACGTHAGLLYAANSTRGNKVCAGAWMYRAVMEDLRDKGFASFDMEKPIDATYPYEHITREMAEEAVRALTGDIQQVPPVFSAVKHQGERSYLIARRGEEAQLTAKSITIYEFEITRFELPDIDFRVRCSKGTYIRALARDFGEALGSGAHLTALRRTNIGSLSVEDAIVPVVTEQKTIG